MKIIFRIIAFLIGLLLCLYPLISGAKEKEYQKNAIQTYQMNLETLEDSAIEQLKLQAQEYNNILFQSKGLIIDNEAGDILKEENYNKLISIDSTGVMGSIDIPKIAVYLPIYHGTDEDSLSVGAGHLFGTSLPVGGNSSRAVLTGHRGLPNSKLFTRLDELEKGDLFYVHVLGETLAYLVTTIEVIEPLEIEKLNTEPDKDLITLLTCTPYGINSHRLLVTGERVPFEEADYDSIKPVTMSFRELFFFILPFVFIGYSGYKLLKVIRKRRRCVR